MTSQLVIDQGFCEDLWPLIIRHCRFPMIVCLCLPVCFYLSWAGKEELLKVFFSSLQHNSLLSLHFPFNCYCHVFSIFGLQRRANQPRELHAVHVSGCVGLIDPCCTQMITQHCVQAASIDRCICVFTGVSLTRCRPLRAAGQRRCSASTWQRDTVRLFSASTAPMTFSSPDPKVNTHNPPSPLHLFPPICLSLISIPHMSACYGTSNLLHFDMLWFCYIRANKTWQGLIKIVMCTACG